MIVRKILLLGEIGVGKTSIARRLVFGTFGDSYKATIGVDIYTYDVTPPPQDVAFKFLVWDTDGSYGESVFRQYYARQAQAAMIVADITRPSTVDTMLRLGQLFADVAPGRYFAHVLNKTDLVETNAAADITGRVAATKAPLFQTSALSGDNVAGAFSAAAGEIIKLES
jgi:small GTP-binding protein